MIEMRKKVQKVQTLQFSTKLKLFQAKFNQLVAFISNFSIIMLYFNKVSRVFNIFQEISVNFSEISKSYSKILSDFKQF